jgi:hypothetical protein
MVDRAKRDDRELRLALFSSGKFDDPSVLFDEFKEVTEDDSAEIPDEEDAVKWDFSTAQLDHSQAEVEREIAEMLAAASTGTNSFEQPTFSDWI